MASLEGWLIIKNGIVCKDTSGIGMINGLHLGSVDVIYNELIDDYVLFLEDTILEDMEMHENYCYFIDFKLTNIFYVEGQMSFPETCQWDFPPHWEYEFEITNLQKFYSGEDCE